ncbi:GGDEF domain-containing protein [Thermomonas sp.]|uniref:GGDEF domain-containing protein n=1 Tax=Thermomonas sp. TaxID=1971895 RepID=UPI002487A1ED|nr:GGDEF domain-containing protein [Thermomonas sp.]MDI1252189.1 GGDEF domain-containing protein [Thermomonas sp.]
MSMLRLRNDFRFAIISLFGVIAVVVILPFAIYRFATGQVIAGSVDLAIVTGLMAGVTYGWRGGNIDRIAHGMVIFYTTGCVVLTTLVGTPGLMWMYPVVMTNFLLVGRMPALLVSAAAIMVLVLHGQAFDSLIERFDFFASASMVSLFAFIFALRTEAQRDQLETLASRDPLTGVLNRRAMEQELQMVIEAHRRLGTTYGLMLLDLDRFKSINDTHGHEAGDVVLVNFATLVQSGIRKLDRMYRIGGEEFVLILPGSNVRGLATICESVRARVETGLRIQGKSITVSIGAAELKYDEDSADWLARADLALYRAKRGGRNRVEIDQGSEPVATARTT